MTERISGPSAVSSAWSAFKKNWKFIVPAVLVTVVVYVVLQALQQNSQQHVFLSLIVALIATIVGIAVTLGWSNIVLKLVRNHSVDWNDFKTNTKSWFPYFLARLIYALFMIVAALVIGAPLILILGSAITASPVLMVIGIILSLAGVVLFIWIAIRYMFVSFVIIDHPQMGAWSIMKESARLTKGHTVELFVFGLLLLLVNIVGLILIVIGLIITVPVSKIAAGYVYEQLKGKHHAHQIKD